MIGLLLLRIKISASNLIFYCHLFNLISYCILFQKLSTSYNNFFLKWDVDNPTALLFLYKQICKKIANLKMSTIKSNVLKLLGFVNHFMLNNLKKLKEKKKRIKFKSSAVKFRF
jgi:hypothetical protein